MSGTANLSLAPGLGPVTGSQILVSPATTTIYTLTASNPGGQATATTTITVRAPDPTATIDVAGSGGTPVASGFAGYNLALVWYGVSHRDLRFRALAASLSPGWIRFPAGTGSLAFDWTTGLQRPDWIARFAAENGTYQLLQGTVPTLGGKGGDRLQDFAEEAAAIGAGAVICVNAATDTPQSAGALAAWARVHGLRVVAYELTNEPYLYSSFFSGGGDYAAKMKPYRDAIKAADPAATVAVFALDAAGGWNMGLAASPDPYWDLLILHHYPNVPQGTAFTEAMARTNADLEAYTTVLTTDILSRFRTGTRLGFSEFGPGGHGSPLPGSLYAGIYTAELLTRLSALPQVAFAGHHQLGAETGIHWSRNHTAEVVAAYQAGTTVDPTSFDWGFFPSAQVLGASLAAAAINGATRALPTSLAGGGTAIAAGSAPVPALHAQAYLAAGGRRVLLVTNKGTSAETLRIRQDQADVPGPFTTAWVGGLDPSTANTVQNPSAVQIQSGSSGNPIAIPPWSVVRVSW